MVKTPRTRHSKIEREPVTIDLAAEKVENAEADAEKTEASKVEPETALKAEQTTEPQEAPKDTETPKSTTPSGGNFGRDGNATRATSQTPQKRSGALAGGVAGGVIALLVAGGLQFSGVLPAVNGTATDYNSSISSLEAQLADLRQKLAVVNSAPPEDSQLEERLVQAENRVGELTASVENLQGAVSSLEDRPASNIAEAVDLSLINNRISELEASVSALQAVNAESADLPKLESEIASLRGQVAGSQQVQTDLMTRLSALEGEIASLSGRVDEQAEGPATAIIIAASALKAAIDRGGAFGAELDTFAALAPHAPEIEALRAYASSGVATRAQLASESDAAANAIIAAARPVEPDAGVVDRLWASAMGLVQVRPVGMVEGDGVPEIAARLDAAVSEGDLVRAVAEFESLPDTAKAAGAPFMERVRARHEVDRLIDEALASALKA